MPNPVRDIAQINEALVVNRATIMQVFEISHNTFANWQKRGMPVYRVEQRGKSEIKEYYLPDVVQWVMEYRTAQSDIDAKKARYYDAQAAKSELDMAFRKGELISRQELIDHWDDKMTVFRQALLNAGAKLAPLVASESDVIACEEVLTNEFHSILEDLSRDCIPASADERLAHSNEIAETTSEKDSEPVG